MSDDANLQVTADLTIPRTELRYRASRAGGPGGQHVNTSATRIELVWDVAGSPSLSREQRTRILGRLARRIDSRGVLRLVEGGSRSQSQNRTAVTDRLVLLVGRALQEPKRRRATRPPATAKEARLDAKKRRAAIKRGRAALSTEE
ncbi:MAG: aminoacyl-tRNA hydrolase [Gemmatimonadetes bacterium]|nr:aminoacyl-tRNA hydrolase [Gemmatimonadota bacterium]